MKNPSPLLFAAILIIGAIASADVVTLNDGRILEGEVKKSESGYVITSADGKVTKIDASSVNSIRLGKLTTTSPKSVSADRLASLRRSVEPLGDIKQIIDRYKQFIEMNKNTPAAADAEADLALWQDRLDRHLAKVSGKWILPEERDQLMSQSSGDIGLASELIKANRLHDAEPLLARTVEVDPKNAAAWYLSGVLFYREDKIPQARKAFESANAALPGDAATLNNLGVILWRQNQYPGALNYYDQAMLALPANKEILNNIAEALAAKRDDAGLKKNAIVIRAAKRFAEQDALLQSVMAQYGWYRWGSAWVDQQMMDRLKQAEQEIKDKIAALQKQFDDAKAKIADDERKIGENERLMQDIEVRSYGRDANGKAFTIPFPQAYYDAQNENMRLQQEQQSLHDQLTKLQQTARQVQQQMPTPKFTGVQKLIDIEGMPRVGAAPEAAVTSSVRQAPATQPTSNPTTRSSSGY